MKRNVSRSKTLHIRWQRLIVDGNTCPRCRSTEKELEKAVRALRQPLALLGIRVVLEKKGVSGARFKEDALASNQLWLNGRLLEEWIGGTVGASPCCDVCGSSECRTIEAGGRTYETVPAGLIVLGGLLAALQIRTRHTGASCGSGFSPKGSERCGCS